MAGVEMELGSRCKLEPDFIIFQKFVYFYYMLYYILYLGPWICNRKSAVSKRTLIIQFYTIAYVNKSFSHQKHVHAHGYIFVCRNHKHLNN